MNDKKEKWIIGVSGGVDSMVLLDRFKDKCECVVAHVNYHKRCDSDLDEQLVKKYCISHDIKFESKDYIDDQSGNFQSMARDFRYEFYKELVDKYQAKGVMLGHHLDDDLETYLFKKQRNSFGLSLGLEPYSYVKNIKVYRPHLDKTKKELYAYAYENNVLFREDASNQDTSYKRNEIRALINTWDETYYWEQINVMRQEKQTWDRQIQKCREYIFSLHTVVSKQEYLYGYDKFGLLFLRLLFEMRNIESYAFTDKYLKEVHKLIINNKCDVELNGVAVIANYNELWIGEIQSFSYTLEKIEYFNTPYFKLSDKGEVIEGITVSDQDFPLTIRNPKVDDEIEMRFGTKRLNRFFIDRKIPKFKRKLWVVVENRDHEVIFVSQLGCDVKHYSNKPNLFVV